MITKSENKYQKMVNSLPNHLSFVSFKILHVSNAKNKIIVREAGLECPVSLGLPRSPLVSPGLPRSPPVFPGLPPSPPVCPSLPWSPPVSPSLPLVTPGDSFLKMKKQELVTFKKWD